MIFPNPKGILLPEMFVRAEIKEGTSEQAICVPQQGVMRNTKGMNFILLRSGYILLKVKTAHLVAATPQAIILLASSNES